MRLQSESTWMTFAAAIFSLLVLSTASARADCVETFRGLRDFWQEPSLYKCSEHSMKFVMVSNSPRMQATYSEGYVEKPGPTPGTNVHLSGTGDLWASTRTWNKKPFDLDRILPVEIEFGVAKKMVGSPIGVWKDVAWMRYKLKNKTYEMGDLTCERGVVYGFETTTAPMLVLSLKTEIRQLPC